MDVFISYADDNKEVVENLAGALRRSGFRVWWDDATKAAAASDTSSSPLSLVGKAHAVILVWSKPASRSTDVDNETRAAIKNKTLVPIRLDKTPLPGSLASISAEDFSNWEGDINDTHFRRLVTKVSRMESFPSGLNGLGPRTLVMGAAGLGLILTASEVMARGITASINTAGLGADFMAWFGLLALAKLVLLTFSDKETGTAPKFVDPSLSLLLLTAFAIAVFYAGGLLALAPNIPMAVIPTHLIWGFQIAMATIVCILMVVSSARFVLSRSWSNDQRPPNEDP